jgi:serine O-acetyltransferase
MLNKIFKDYQEYSKRSRSYLKPFFNPCFYINVNFRISHFFYRLKLLLVAKIFWTINRVFFAVDIDPGAKLSGGFLILHGIGIVIGRHVETRGIVRIYQGVTLGGNNLKIDEFEGKEIKQPVLMGNNIIGINSVIIGPIVIGSNATIGSGSVITKSVKQGLTVVGNNKILY